MPGFIWISFLWILQKTIPFIFTEQGRQHCVLLTNLEDHVPVFMKVTGWHRIPPGTRFPFRRLIRMVQVRWTYSNPPTQNMEHDKLKNSKILSQFWSQKMYFHNGYSAILLRGEINWKSMTEGDTSHDLLVISKFPTDSSEHVQRIVFIQFYGTRLIWKSCLVLMPAYTHIYRSLPAHSFRAFKGEVICNFISAHFHEFVRHSPITNALKRVWNPTWINRVRLFPISSSSITTTPIQHRSGWARNLWRKKMGNAMAGNG
jgi:hypothetical protein